MAHWKHFDAFQAYLEQHPHIVPILSVGGWGADGFSRAASTAEGRAAFVEDALGLMREYGFLGVDIDWEYPGSSDAGIGSSAADRENYTLLLQALRGGLDALTAADGIPRRLCIALSGSPWLVPSIQCGEIGQIVDQVNLMTYDMQFSTLASHHTALYASNPSALSAAGSVQAYTAAGIPAEKIMLGVAFYGHRWRTREPEPLYKKATWKNTLTYTQIARLIEKNRTPCSTTAKRNRPTTLTGACSSATTICAPLRKRGCTCRNRACWGCSRGSTDPMRAESWYTR